MSAHLARALFVALGAPALTVGINTTALAQTSVTGNIFGRVDAAVGTTVVIENTEASLTQISSNSMSGLQNLPL